MRARDEKCAVRLTISSPLAEPRSKTSEKANRNFQRNRWLMPMMGHSSANSHPKVAPPAECSTGWQGSPLSSRASFASIASWRPAVVDRERPTKLSTYCVWATASLRM